MANPVRRIYDAQFKAKVVLETLKERKTRAQLSSEFGIHAQMITGRKRLYVSVCYHRLVQSHYFKLAVEQYVVD